MKIAQVSTVSFHSITPVTSNQAGFSALESEARKSGKTKYILNDPYFMKEKAANEQYTRYLITGKEYKKYSLLPPSKKLYQAGIYDYNRKPVEITENSKSLISKLIKRI